ncbi:MAG: hypothetical protein R3F53_01375 [Gammaproteobacteria bacterium]
MREFILALIGALFLIAGLIYFVQVLWPLLPTWVSLIVFIIIAIIIIGAPIYSLARWSNRRWSQLSKDTTPAPADKSRR